jgi:hypothetical protein
MIGELVAVGSLLPFIIIIIFHPSSLSTYVSTIGKEICK